MWFDLFGIHVWVANKKEQINSYKRSLDTHVYNNFNSYYTHIYEIDPNKL